MAYRYLTFQDRQKLAELYGKEVRIAEIAKQLGVHQATIYTELKRGYTGEDDKNHRPGYDPVKGQRSVTSGIHRKGPKAKSKVG